jgi:hypothetical protein
MGWVPPGTIPSWAGYQHGPSPMTSGPHHGAPMQPQNADEETGSLEGSAGGVPQYSGGGAAAGAAGEAGGLGEAAAIL